MVPKHYPGMCRASLRVPRLRENLLVEEVQFCYVKTGKVHVIPARHGARLEKLGGGCQGRRCISRSCEEWESSLLSTSACPRVFAGSPAATVGLKFYEMGYTQQWFHQAFLPGRFGALLRLAVARLLCLCAEILCWPRIGCLLHQCCTKLSITLVATIALSVRS